MQKLEWFEMTANDSEKSEDTITYFCWIHKRDRQMDTTWRHRPRSCI